MCIRVRIHIRSMDWKEQQVFQLLIQALWFEEDNVAIHLDTYKGEPAYRMTKDNMEYVGTIMLIL